MLPSPPSAGSLYSTNAVYGSFGVGGPGAYIVRVLAKRTPPVHILTRGIGRDLPAGCTAEVIHPPPWVRALRGTRLARFAVRSQKTERLEFDREAARRAPACRLAVLEQTTALETLRVLGARGTRTILKYNNPPFARMKAEVDEEVRRWGGPPFFIDDALVERTREECRRADLVHAVSETVAEGLVRDGVPRAKIRVTRYGVDSARFHPAPQAPERFVVAFVGWMNLYKGFPYLVEAFRDAAIPGSELVLHGGTNIAHNHRIVERLRGNSSVRVVRGPVEETYSRASVVVLPSLAEGFPNIILETMACGIPIILSDLAGAPYMVSEGLDGFVVPARDSGALRDRLLQLHGDPEAARRMGAAAREKALLHPWSRFEEDVEEMVDEALSMR